MVSDDGDLKHSSDNADKEEKIGANTTAEELDMEYRFPKNNSRKFIKF